MTLENPNKIVECQETPGFLARPLRVLIGCEFSGVVRDAFTARGHDAWSCDLLPTERPGQHIQQDIFTASGRWALPTDFDLLIAFPPCTHLAASGARWFDKKQVEQRKAIWFFTALCGAPIDRIAIENPIGIMSTLYRQPDQIIQPWQFGHGETKATCLWLKNLPRLVPTNIVDGRTPRVHCASPGPERWKERSRTLPGIAAAMADQWSLHTSIPLPEELEVLSSADSLRTRAQSQSQFLRADRPMDGLCRAAGLPCS